MFNQTTSMTLLVVSLSVTLFSTVAFANNKTITKSHPTLETSIGVAQNWKKETVYIEKHQSKLVDQKLMHLTTKYFEDCSNEFAELKSDFSTNTFIPNYQFVDYRIGQKDVIRKTESGFQIEHKAGQKSENKKMSAKKVDQKTVSGQGFHSFLRANLHKFVEEPKKKFAIRFLVPTHEEPFDFRIETLKLDEGQKKIRLKISAQSWLFRLFAPSMEVLYDYSKLRLLEFKGPSNVKSKDGETQKVTIKYSYENQAEVCP